MRTVPVLDVTPDPATWFIGPSDERPVEAWLPEAVDLLKRTIDGDTSDPGTEHYLTLMLARIGRPDDSPLPYKIIRWLDLTEMPFVAAFGMVRREDLGEAAEQFLGAFDAPAVEPPVLESLPAAPDVDVRRSLAYSDIGGGLLVEARYVVDTRDPEVVVLVQAANRVPGRVVAALDDLDAFATSIRVLREDV